MTNFILFRPVERRDTRRNLQLYDIHCGKDQSIVTFLSIKPNFFISASSDGYV
jgi:hypothetical protein